MKTTLSRMITWIILLSLAAGLALDSTQGSLAAPNRPDAAPQSAWQLEDAGQISGPVTSVAVQGSYAYAGTGDAVTIFDLSDPGSPVPVGRISPLSYQVEEIKVAGSYAYLSDGSGGVWVVDVSDPAHPLETGFYDTPSFAHEVAISGSYLYVADFDQGLRVVDVSDPSAPLEVGAFDWVQTYSLDVSGEVAFLANVAEGLKAVNVSNPAAPFEISTLELISDTMDVAVSGDYAYIANDLYGLKVVDVSDPAHMRLVGEYDTPGYAMEVTVAGEYAYVADSGGGLRVIDISDPENPFEAGFYDTPGWAMQAVVYDGTAYVADYLNGLWVVDVSDPAAISLAGAYRTPADAQAMTIAGSLGFVADIYLGLLIVDLSNPALPVGVGLYTPPSIVRGVAVAGSLAYLANDGSGLRIVDVSDPANPVEVGFVDTPDQARDVAVAGNYAYVADTYGGLRVFDISDPASPQEVYFDRSSDFIDGVVVAGNYLFVRIGFLNYDSGIIQVREISDPLAPQIVAYYECPVYPTDMTVQGDYLYLSAAGLQVVDVSDPANPVEAGFYATPLASYGVAVSGSYAYLAVGGYDYNASLQVIDVSNPTAPVEVSALPVLYALDAAVSGSYVYVTGDGYGVRVLRFTPPLADTNFRILRDGYSFANYPVKDYGDYTIQDMQRMFGNEAVCWMEGTGCGVGAQASLWNVHAHQLMSQGRSYGMAVSGLRFLQGVDTHPWADTVFALDKTSEVLFNWQAVNYLVTLRQEIGFFLVSQLAEPLRYSLHQARQATPNAVFAQVNDAMQGDDSDPLFLVLFDGQRGHALIPYALTSPSDGVYWAWVYDNEHPADLERAVVFDTHADAWRYDTGNGVWSGDASTHTLGALPTSLHSEVQLCPWCAAELHSAATSHLLALAGDGHLLVTDSQGRQLGYAGSETVEDIPGGYGSLPVLGTGAAHEPLYTLPLTETYQVLLDGGSLDQAGAAGLWQFGPGYAASIQGLVVAPDTQDRLVIANDGTQLSYQASQPQSPAMSLALDTSSASYGLTVQWVDIGAGETLTLSADTTAGTLTLNGEQASGGSYNLVIRQASAAGVFSFYHSDIPLLPGDTHLIHFGSWDGSGTLTLQIDHASDGIYDETVLLENQVKWYSLPLVVK